MTRAGAPLGRPILAGLIGAALAVATAATAQNVGDANCDGGVDNADLLAMEVATFEGSGCARAEVNGDGVLSAADIVAEIPLVVGALAPPVTATVTTSTPPTTPAITPSPTPTLTATVTPTLSAAPPPTVTARPTITPTFVTCPASPAAVLLTVSIPFGDVPISATVSGRLSAPSCINAAGLDETYSVVVGAAPQTIGHLAPGTWVHTLDVGSTGQHQHLRNLLLANTGTTAVRFTTVASVATVATTDDAGAGSLREAVRVANLATAPARIQFDEGTFVPGIPTVITLAAALPVIHGSGITLDGIDATGAGGNRVIDAGGQPITGLAISGAANTVIGMRLRNTGGNNRDVVSITGPNARANVIERCIVEQSGTADGIGIDNGAGSDFLGNANVVRDSEISAAADKGIKVTANAYARLERNWVHDNANGGIQSTLSGHVLARDNLVEHNRGATAQNGVSVNGAAPDTPSIASEVMTDGNLVRLNGSDGISIRGVSLGVINNDALLANASDGLRIFDENGAATAAVQGIVAACNGVDGAAVAGTSQADLGGGQFSSAGNNAFTQNNLPGGAANLRNGTAMQIYAENAQWEHCGQGTQCSESAILAYDVSDHGARTLIQPARAHRTLVPPAVSAVRPAKGMAGDLIRIFGSGFNAIDGYAAGTACADVAGRNRCAPQRGNCVRINNVPASIEAVTPTMLVARLPFTCVEPQALTVQTQGGGISAPFTVCTNAGE
jgi:hypothetical protein